MSRNLLSASLVLLVLAVWLGSGYLHGGKTPDETPGPSANQTTELHPVDRVAHNDDKRVRVSLVTAQTRTRHVVLHGQTNSKRMVDVAAEITGAIVSRPVERGMRVQEGDLLCEVAVEDRGVALGEARAALRTARLEYQGSLSLKEQDLLSDVAIANANARLEAAQAQVHRREIALERTRIVAPFSGVVEDLHMNIGDYAVPGAPCATLIDLNPMLVVAHVTESEVEYLKHTQAVSGVTSTGRELQGMVSFVGKQSDPATRTYPVEITVANEDYSIRSGLTVTLRIGVDRVPAHRVSPSLLTLDDNGEMGIRIVDRYNRVAFKPVEIIEDSAQGMWITGLPDTVSLITVGQEYVAVGDLVEPVFGPDGTDQFARL